MNQTVCANEWPKKSKTRLGRMRWAWSSLQKITCWVLFSDIAVNRAFQPLNRTLKQKCSENLNQVMLVIAAFVIIVEKIKQFRQLGHHFILCAPPDVVGCWNYWLLRMAVSSSHIWSSFPSRCARSLLRKSHTIRIVWAIQLLYLHSVR